jgi:predicted nucleic acid-binding protein
VKAALDTNILVYAEGVNDAAKAGMARSLMGRLGAHAVIPLQVLAEFFHVLTVKARIPAEEARDLVSELSDLQPIVPTSPDVLALAMELVARHRFRIFDAIVVCAAIMGGCRLLLSEDMQDGFQFQGLTIVNPFADPPHPDLASFLARLPESP